MTRVLLTGMSATGKSTLVAMLREVGVAAVDTDDGWVDVLPDGTQRWRVDDLRRLLAGAGEGPIVVAGCEENLGELLAAFDLVVLLSAPREVLLRRLDTRTTNHFGRDPAQRRRILSDLAEVEPRLRVVADHELDTSGDPQDTLTTLLALITGPPAR